MMRRDFPELGERASPSHGVEVAGLQALSPAAASLDGANSIGFARNWRSFPIPRRSAIFVDTARAIVNCQVWLTSTVSAFVLAVDPGWGCDNLIPLL